MKSFSRVCPQCQRPLISNEMYCSWCNTYSPEARSNTTSGFSPPYPQYTTDLSSQNWPQTDLMQDFSGKKIMSPQQPRSVSKRLKRPLLIGGVLGVCLLVAVSFLLGRNLGTNEHPSTRAAQLLSTATSTQVTPTQAISAQATSTQITPTQAAPDQATSTPVAPASLPAASLRSPRLPLKIACVNCPYPQLTVTLNRIEMDSPGLSTRWIFSLLNSGSSSCSDFRFYTISLADATGTNYRGQGQVESSFAMSAGQSVQQIALFAVLPAAGTQYTLQLRILMGGCDNGRLSGYLNTYQTQNFTFA